MPEMKEENDAAARNRQIVEELRESFRAAEQRLTPTVEPAVVFSPASAREDAE